MRLVLLVLTTCTLATAAEFSTILPADTTRPWIAPELWTNPAEDWQLRDGRIENTHSGGNRNVVLLTHELPANPGTVAARVTIDQLSKTLSPGSWVGFQIGLQGAFDDYRDSAIYGSGFCAGLFHGGRLFLGAFDESVQVIKPPFHNITLTLDILPDDNGTYTLELRALDAQRTELSMTRRTKVHPAWLRGLTALTASSGKASTVDLTQPRQPAGKTGVNFTESAAKPGGAAPKLGQQRGGECRFAFSAWKMTGEKIAHHPDHAFGPVLWTTHTRSNDGTVRLLTQLAPLGAADLQHLSLHLDPVGPGRLAEPGPDDVDPLSRTILTNLVDTNPAEPLPYHLTYQGRTVYTGTIPPVPADKTTLTVASLSCNDSTGFPHNDLVANITAQKPDFLTFHGDQIYEMIGGYGLVYDQKPDERAVLSYLRKYYMHGWVWQDLLRDIPSITIPDDHDVFHGNLWGAGGRLADISKGMGNWAQDSGGYKMSPQFVNVVHRTQTGNLPPGPDRTPCDSGISVYFTSLPFGPLDFAVLADRQWKSAPRDMLPDAEIENGWPQNLKWNPVTQAAHPDAQLLGPRQEKFFAHWAAHKPKEAKFRIVISQSPWLAPQTLPADMHHDRDVPKLPVYNPGQYAPDDEPKPDFDTNGWPQEKRTAALRIMKEAGALHITGDQHLGTTGQYGLDSYNDGPFWISSPAIANVWPRRWMPKTGGRNRPEGWARWLGAFDDAYGNKFTLHAVANPHHIDREPSRLFDRAVGYAITTYDTTSGRVSLAVWPYWASPAKPAPDNNPYPGWPVHITP